MGAKKRPAAADSGKDELKEPRTVESFATETSIVKPEDTVTKICEAARLVRSDKADKLVWCSAFDGTNMRGYTLGLLQVPAHHAFGSEKAGSPAFFALKNFDLRETDRYLIEDCCWLMAVLCPGRPRFLDDFLFPAIVLCSWRMSMQHARARASAMFTIDPANAPQRLPCWLPVSFAKAILCRVRNGGPATPRMMMPCPKRPSHRLRV